MNTYLFLCRISLRSSTPVLSNIVCTSAVEIELICGISPDQWLDATKAIMVTTHCLLLSWPMAIMVNTFCLVSLLQIGHLNWSFLIKGWTHVWHDGDLTLSGMCLWVHLDRWKRSEHNSGEGLIIFLLYPPYSLLVLVGWSDLANPLPPFLGKHWTACSTHWRSGYICCCLFHSL